MNSKEGVYYSEKWNKWIATNTTRQEKNDEKTFLGGFDCCHDAVTTVENYLQTVKCDDQPMMIDHVSEKKFLF